MDKKSIIRLAIKYCTDEITDEESYTVLHLSEEEFDLFSKMVKIFSPNRA